MKLFRNTFISVFMAVLLIFTPVNLPIIQTTNVTQAATVKLSNSKATVYVGNTLTLSLSGTKSTAKWSTSSEKIAKVSSKGVVTAVKKGSATITATIGKSKYKCLLSVKDPFISHKSISLNIGETNKLTITGATGTVTWTSSNTKLATVSKYGTVTAKASGIVKITGKDKKNSYTSTVTIKDQRITADKTTISSNSIATITLTIKDKAKDETISYVSSNENIADCAISDWTGNTATLYIMTGNKGKATINLYSNKSKDPLTLTVLVADDSRTTKEALDPVEIYDKCASSVVQINTNRGFGTGFFISKDVIATNYHVIEGATEITVLLNDTTYKINSILGYDEALDIALLRVSTKGKPLVLSSFTPKVGSTVYTIGSSRGLTGTFSDGLVTANSRIIDDVDYMQINAAIYPGNSGGPLLNAYGEVVGINTLGLEDSQNINFAINIYELYYVDTSNPISATDFYTKNQEEYEYNELTEDTTKSGSMSTAQLIENNTVIYGSINPMPAFDFYQFTLTEASTVTFIATNNTDLEDDIFHVNLGIFDQNDEQLQVTYIDDGYVYTTITLQPGTYYAELFTSTENLSKDVPYVAYFSFE